MRRIGRSRVYACLAALLTAAIAGCGNGGLAEAPSTSEPDDAVVSNVDKSAITVFDWNDDGDRVTAIYDELVARYNARQDLDVVLEVQRIQGEPYWTKLNAVIAANNAPDIILTHASGRMKVYRDAEKIMPLDTFLQNDPEWYSRFHPGVFDLMTFDGETYGIPVSLALTGLFYNREIFDAHGLNPPTTYGELKHVIGVLRDAGITPFAFGAREGWAAAVLSEVIANRIGGSEPFEAIMSGKGDWEDPSFIRTGYIMQELADMGAFPDNFLSLNYPGMTEMFKRGDAAMMVMGSWVIGSVLEPDSLVQHDIGVVKFPVFEDGLGDVDVWLGQPDYNFSLSSSTGHAEAAIQFLKMWSEPEVQGQLLAEGGRITVAETAVDPERVPALARELNDLAADMKGMFIYYDVGLGPTVGVEYNNTIQAILAGKPPEDAFRELAAFAAGSR